jgi:hypothetical protein
MKLQVTPPPIPKPIAVAAPQPPKQARRPASLKFKELFFRVVIVSLLVCSIGVAWYCFAWVLVPRQQQSQKLTTSIARLSSEVDELERRWSPAEAQQVSNQFTQVKQKLFADQPALANWLATLREHSVPLSLDVQADIGSAVPKSTNGPTLAVIPTTVTIDVQPFRDLRGLESPYRRILRLSEQLIAQEKRADLKEIRVYSGTNSVARATMLFELWAGEETGQ